MTGTERIIGLTGTNGAGKGEVAAFFASAGFAAFSLSDIIRDELRSKGLEPSRDNLIREGNALRRRFGPDILARRVMERVRGRSVIDSIRNPAEVAYLRTHGGFTLLAIDAPAGVRYERVRRRGRDESAPSLEAFLAKEAEEMSLDARGQQLRTCIGLADRVIVNDGSLAQLHKKLEPFL